MYADARLSAAIESMVRGIEAAPAPISAIRVRMSAPLVLAPRRKTSFTRYVVAAAAVIALFFAIFPKTSLALVEGIVVNGYQAVWKVIGWTPPPRPSKTLERSVVSESGSLAAAQSKATFRIVPPAGLPSGIVSAKIQTNPMLIYTKASNSWSKGPVSVWFTYRLADGRTLQLMAEPYDPRTGLPPKYIFEGDEAGHGRVALTKNAHYAWRNGDQVMSATEGDGITSRDIEAIRNAMHGVELRAWEPGQPDSSTIVKQYRLP